MVYSKILEFINYIDGFIIDEDVFSYTLSSGSTKIQFFKMVFLDYFQLLAREFLHEWK